ncbi:MAG: OmpA family protein [Alphaproteobacteria bacterium]|nr:OmpA family protein [Alphaproteobacteria bacterium]
MLQGLSPRGLSVFVIMVIGSVFGATASPAAAGDTVVNKTTLIEQLKPKEKKKYRSLKPVQSAPPSVALDIRFGFNSAELTGQARQQLDQLGAALTSDALAGFTFDIEGHTDAKGSDTYNLSLSDQRARAVKRYLVERYGVDAGRLRAVGFGESKLRHPEDPEHGDNRRVEIVNTGS